MKQIVQDKDFELVKKVSIKDMYTNYGSQTVLAYVTGGGNGLGIMQSLSDGTYGFIYHRDLIKQERSRIYYPAKSQTQSLRNALDADKLVLAFDNFQEFLDYAVTHSAH